NDLRGGAGGEEGGGEVEGDVDELGIPRRIGSSADIYPAETLEQVLNLHGAVKEEVIATDVDGTLIPAGYFGPHPSAVRALKKAAGEGVKWVLATGKTRRGAIDSLARGTGGVERGYLEGMDGVFLQGLVVWKEGEVIYERKLAREAVEKAEGLVEGREGVEIVGYDGDEIWCGKGGEGGKWVRELNEKYSEPRVMPLAAEGLTSHPGAYHKLIILAPPNVISSIRSSAAPFGRPQGFALTQALPTMLEVLPPHTGKCEGLKFLLRSYGLPSTALAAAGDAENDEDMLEFAGVGFAAGDATEGAKGRADFVLGKGAGEGGVAEGVKRALPNVFKRIKFVTGNPNKVREVEKLMDDAGVLVEQAEVDLPELQGSDAKEIAMAKLMEAEKLLPDTALFIEDTSLGFDALSGLPGPYIKWFLKKVGHHGLKTMLDGFGDYGAEAKTTIAYTDGEGNRSIVEGSTRGIIVEPRNAERSFGWDPVFQCEEGDVK
ncbi:hypothetical protein TrRE_jg68, partial [Triparma retinervis]